MSSAASQRFLVARNPDSASSLAFLVRLPIEGGIVLKARAPWPTTARVYCHAHDGEWPDGAELVDDVAVVQCRRRGPAVDLVLDRPQQARSQFIFTEVRGRPAIFWQTQKVARTANPGGRVPRRRALTSSLVIRVDTREKYPYRFAGRDVTVEREAIPAGDYGVRAADRWIATVERKSVDNLLSSLSDGTLAFQLTRLAELPLAAVVVEGRYPALFEAPRVPEGWLPDVLAPPGPLPRGPDRLRRLAQVRRGVDLPLPGRRAGGRARGRRCRGRDPMTRALRISPGLGRRDRGAGPRDHGHRP